MSTTTLPRPHVVVTPVEPVGVVAADGTVTFFGQASARLSNAAHTAGRWVREGLRAFKLDALFDSLKGAGAWALGKIRWGWTRMMGLGRLNLVGTALTCGAGRDGLTSILGTAYRVVLAPVSLLLRPLAWLLRTARLGKVCDLALGARFFAEITVKTYYGKAMAFLDAREHSTAMSIARLYFQTRILLGVFRMFFPAAHALWAFLLVLLTPVFGVREQSVEHKATMAAKAMQTITGEKATVEQSLAKAEAKVAQENEAAIEEVLVFDTAFDQSPVLLRALATRNGYKKDLIYPATRVTDHRNETWIVFNDDNSVLERDLDAKMWEIGTVAHPLPVEERLLASVAEASRQLEDSKTTVSQTANQVAKGTAPKVVHRSKGAPAHKPGH